MSVSKSVSNALANARSLTNADLWDACRKFSPQFASYTSKATKELFTERGFESLQLSNANIINEFFLTSIRIFLNVVNIAHVKDPLRDAGFGEEFENAYGGIMQRMAVHSIKPISPKFKGLVDGKSVDPWVVRKPTISERFWKANFDFQNLLTMQHFNIKQIFISEYGVSELLVGILEQLENSYKVQQYENKLEALNAYINSTSHPLQETQVYTTTYTTGTETELKNFYLTVKNILSLFDITPQSSAFNSMRFNTTQDKSRLKMLVRPGIINSMSIEVLSSAFNPSEYNLGIDVIQVDNFGGLKPFKEPEFTTPLYEVYDTFGTCIGYAETENAQEVTVEENAVFWKDPNADIISVIADKGVVFTSMQNPVQVNPIFNPAGLYTNYWMSSPNNTYGCDSLYNLVVIKKSA